MGLVELGVIPATGLDQAIPKAINTVDASASDVIKELLVLETWAMHVLTNLFFDQEVGS